MTSPSTHFKALKASLAGIRPITNNVNKLFCETPVQHLKVRSFILLSHAALEEYLENAALDIALKARTLYKSKGYITKALVGLISSGVLEEINAGKQKKKITQDVFKNIDVFSLEAYNQFVAKVATNHGIKRDNQLNLFLPIGVNPDEVDFATVAALDAFGAKRGEIAHKAKITKIHTLSEILTDLETIAKGLRALDTAAQDALKVRMSKP